MTEQTIKLVTDQCGMIDTQYYYNQASTLRAEYLKSLIKKLFNKQPKARTRFSAGSSLVLGQPA